MEIRQGWSGEIGPNQWAKFDVTLNEGDLVRLLRKAGLGHLKPVEIPIADAFQILEAEAEILVIAKLVTRYGMPNDDAAEAMARMNANQQSTFAKLREDLAATV